jgi:hypothetical protein
VLLYVSIFSQALPPSLLSPHLLVLPYRHLAAVVVGHYFLHDLLLRGRNRHTSGILQASCQVLGRNFEGLLYTNRHLVYFFSVFKRRE